MGVGRPIDITADQRKTVLALLKRYLPNTTAWVYGSRATWTSRPQSDLDMVVFATPEQNDRVAELREAFEESDLPFRVDLFVWDTVPEEFRKRIEAEHVVLVENSDKRLSKTNWLSHPNAPKDWQIRSIEDVCLRVTSGGTPSRRNPTFFENASWPWLKTKELHDGWLDDAEEHITESAIASSSAKILPEKTILMAMYGATVGQLGILRHPMTCNQACSALVVNPKKADYRYLFYQLLDARSQIKSLATGAAQQNLSGTLIKSLRFSFPPLTEQRAIAHILGTLDDKIELNRRMNETLEAMARALFKSWFVDFDPVRAKMEGRWRPGESLPGLPAHLYDLFPDRLVESELGEVPEGWGVKELKECMHLTMGQSPPGSTYNDNGKGLPFFQGRTDFGFRYPTNRKYCTAPTRIAECDDTLVSVRAPVGDINMAWEKCCAGRGVAVLRHRSGARSFTYYSAWAIQQELKQYEHSGTVFGAINKKQFEALSVVEPTPEIVARFESQIGLIDDYIRKNVYESRTLVNIRDLLLPNLISGEIRLHETAKAVEAMV